jgi:hypothetical protein
MLKLQRKDGRELEGQNLASPTKQQQGYRDHPVCSDTHKVWPTFELSLYPSFEPSVHIGPWRGGREWPCHAWFMGRLSERCMICHCQ